MLGAAVECGYCHHSMWEHSWALIRAQGCSWSGEGQDWEERDDEAET